MALLLVRHAKAGNRFDWDGEDVDRPLSTAGRRQAAGLVDELAPYSVKRVLSSPFRRCVVTVEPLAAARGIEIELAVDLAEGESPLAARLARAILAKGDEAALCTHGDVVPEVLWRLVARDRFLLPASKDLRCAKGSAWVLESDDSRVVRATYLPPRR